MPGALNSTTLEVASPTDVYSVPYLFTRCHNLVCGAG